MLRMPEPSTPERNTAQIDFADSLYRSAVIDLLGALGYGELQAFERLAGDAKMAPDFYNRSAIAEMAVAEFGHFKALRARLVELGADPEIAMAPFRRRDRWVPRIHRAERLARDTGKGLRR